MKQAQNMLQIRKIKYFDKTPELHPNVGLSSKPHPDVGLFHTNNFEHYKQIYYSNRLEKRIAPAHP